MLPPQTGQKMSGRWADMEVTHMDVESLQSVVETIEALLASVSGALYGGESNATIHTVLAVPVK